MSFFVKTTDLDRLATSGEFQETGELLQLDHPSRIFLDLQQKDIRSFRRENADLIVEASNGSQLRIANFYQENGDSQLYLKGEDGGLMLAVLSPVDESGSLFSQYVALTEASPFESVEGASGGLFSAQGESDGSWLADNWGLVALGVLGIGGAGAAVAGLGDGGGDSNTAPATVVVPEPAVPSISENGSGAFSAGALTIIDDTTPTFTGAGATVGNTITLYDGTTVIGTATVTVNGWALTPTTPLAENTYAFTLTEKDATGRESAHSSAFNVTIKTGELTGGSGDDLLIGGAGDNILDGGAGNDTLVDGSGNDVFKGGAGNDEIVITSVDVTSIDGGLDVDTLTLDNVITLNTDTLSGTISNIERVDMAYDSAANTLTLTPDAVLAMTDANHQLQIVGDANDTLNASGAVEQPGQQQEINGVIYDQYTFGSTLLLVDHDIIVNG
ncbi:MAG: BapA/Bap/LapF family prefix-like domain-containing protein [Gammaproteobacteria bacterium]